MGRQYYGVPGLPTGRGDIVLPPDFCGTATPICPETRGAGIALLPAFCFFRTLCTLVRARKSSLQACLRQTASKSDALTLMESNSCTKHRGRGVALSVTFRVQTWRPRGGNASRAIC
jgi:hypothetical protein